MSSIVGNPRFVVVGEFEIDPPRQQEFVAALADKVEQHFKTYPGFISVSFHASDDGQRVVSYGQWRSKEDWERVFRNEQSPPLTREVVQSFGAKPRFFSVARVVENT